MARWSIWVVYEYNMWWYVGLSYMKGYTCNYSRVFLYSFLHWIYPKHMRENNESLHTIFPFFSSFLFSPNPSTLNHALQHKSTLHQNYRYIRSFTTPLLTSPGRMDDHPYGSARSVTKFIVPGRSGFCNFLSIFKVLFFLVWGFLDIFQVWRQIFTRSGSLVWFEVLVQCLTCSLFCLDPSLHPYLS